MKHLWLLCALLLLSGCCAAPLESQPEPISLIPETLPPETLPPETETTQPVLTGWVEEGSRKYYYNEDGVAVTGWQTIGEETFYFLPDGTMAVGEVEIDGVPCHFTAWGQRILVANPWNYIPEDYAPDLVPLPKGYGVENSQVDRSCYDALLAMLDACNKERPYAMVISSYRTHEQQVANFNRKVRFYLNQGYSQRRSEEKAARIIAIPGTSEHQLGLAVDIIDTRLWALEWEQADLPAQQWLMEHCWEYGFILRYPDGKTEETGIIFEPWHYRYVGLELAKVLHEQGLTLEAYLQSISQ